MLDRGIREQLKSVFAALEQPVTLRVAKSAHETQVEMLEMVESLAQTSDKIVVERADTESLQPRLTLVRQGRLTGVSFRGVPGGHEFSSLVLSVLYADGKGKQPDEGILRRIRNLRGPIRLTTYVSLTCENCPEVVQALNLMAIHHPDFHHETVDGGVAIDEVHQLGIQGVPAVFCDGKLLHSGKISLADLLANLEATFGTVQGESEAQDLGEFDVAVIGGGPAGASAAIYSVRKGLKTVLIAERFGGQLQDTKGIENMISMPYTEGVKLASELAQHVRSYPVTVLEHRRVNSIKPVSESDPGAGRVVELASGEFIKARAIIIATGAKWRELGIPGEREHIGRGVAFCAHCDGPFYKGKRVVVVGGGNSGVEAAIDLAHIARDVTLLEYNAELKADKVLVAKLKALPNAAVVTNAKTLNVVGEGGKVIGLEYQDRVSGESRRIDTDGIFVQIGLLPNTQFVKGLVELNQYGEIMVDGRGRTSAPGIYAAGDVTPIPFKQIITAMGDGAKVALAAFEDRMRSQPI